jgi:hypothetical protein
LNFSEDVKKQMKQHRVKSIEAYGQASKLEEPEAVTRLLDVYDRMRKAAASHDGVVVVELTRLLDAALDYEANATLAFRVCSDSMQSFASAWSRERLSRSATLRMSCTPCGNRR